MPTYIYRCSNCGASENARRAVDDRDAPYLGVCGHLLQRGLAAPAFRAGPPAFSHARADAVTAEVHGLHSVAELPPGLRSNPKERA